MRFGGLICLLVVRAGGMSVDVDSGGEATLNSALNQAISLFQRNQLESSVAILVSAWKNYPDHPRVRNNMRALASKLALMDSIELGCDVAHHLVRVATPELHDLTHYSKIASRCNGTSAVAYAAGLLQTFCDDRAGRSGAEDEYSKASFVLGELHGHLGNVDSSFRYYSIANGIVRRNLEPNLVEDAIARMELNRKVFDNPMNSLLATRSQAAPSSRAKMDPIRHQVFVLGFPRSGTSLVEKIISAHPQVKALGEHSVLRFIDRSLRQEAESSGHGIGTHVERIPRDRLQQLSRHSQDALLEGVDSPSITHISSSVNLDVPVAWLIPLLYPDARIIWVRRCAMDTAWSNFIQSFRNRENLAYAFDLNDIARYYNSFQSLIDHWQSALGTEMMEVTYENLVESPEYSIRALTQFLGLPWDDRVLKFSEQVASDGVSSSSVFEVHQPMYKNSIGKWKGYADYLTPLVEGFQKHSRKEKQRCAMLIRLLFCNSHCEIILN